ncbi:MAG: hypothetical protein ACD_60C00087G0024 [uncultured bacterium]|nr:MAG: hypothetical protein ACD_60C00087G0024 [uncultured bacterium]
MVYNRAFLLRFLQRIYEVEEVAISAEEGLQALKQKFARGLVASLDQLSFRVFRAVGPEKTKRVAVQKT